jgi:hypothetical protein
VNRFFFGQHRVTGRRIEIRQVKTRQRHARIIVEVALYSARTTIDDRQSDN